MPDARLEAYFRPLIERPHEAGRDGSLTAKESRELLAIAAAQDRVIRHLASHFERRLSRSQRPVRARVALSA